MAIAGDLLVAPCILFSIAIILTFGRIYSRWSRRGLALDDLLFSAGVGAATGLFILSTLSIVNGIGQPMSKVPVTRLGYLARLQLFCTEFYVWSATFVKLSLAVMLYRIQADNKAWRWGLRFMIGFLSVFVIACCLWDYLQCRPIQANWDPSYGPDACATNAFVKWIYAASSIFLITDVIFAALPILFISKIQRPLREKIVLFLLMGLGLVCAAAVIPKFIALQHFGDKANFTTAVSGTVLWAQIEVYVGIIAVCIPVLKSSGESALRKMGLLTSTGGGGSVSGYGSRIESSTNGHPSKHASVGNSRFSLRKNETEFAWIDLDKAQHRHPDTAHINR